MPILKKAKTILKKIYDYGIHENKKEWERRKFHFYIVFGTVENENAPWQKSKWNELFEPIINELIKISPEQKNTGIKVDKYERQVLKAKKDNKEFDYYHPIKIGHLKWNKSSHEKWTIENEENIRFKSFECWTPIWTICEKTSSAPDVFISIHNEEDLNRKISNLQFSVFSLFAIAEDLQVHCDSFIIDYSKKIGAERTIKQSRRWSKARKDKNWTFSNWINDTWSNGIYKGESLHQFKFSDVVFDEYWETIYKHE